MNPNILRSIRPAVAVALLLGSSACSSELTSRQNQYEATQMGMAEAKTDVLDAVTAARGLSPLPEFTCTNPVRIGSGAVGKRLAHLYPAMAGMDPAQREATSISVEDIQLHHPLTTTLVVSCMMPAPAIAMSSQQMLTVAYEIPT